VDFLFLIDCLLRLLLFLVPLFNFVSRIQLLEVWKKGLKLLERTWLSLSFHCQPSFLVFARVYRFSEREERDSGNIDGRVGL